MDATAVSAWQAGRVVLPSMVRDGSRQSKKLLETLVVSMLAMAVALLLTMVVTANYMRDWRPENSIVCWFIVALANCSGWCAVNWLREAYHMARRNDEVPIFEEAVVAATLPGLPFTAVSQPTTRSQAPRLRVGNGGRP